MVCSSSGSTSVADDGADDVQDTADDDTETTIGESDQEASAGEESEESGAQDGGNFEGGEECEPPSGQCLSSTPPAPQEEMSLGLLVAEYCDVYATCACGGYVDEQACVDDLTAKLAAQESEAQAKGLVYSPICVGIRLAYLTDMGCLPERAINPPVNTVESCDYRSCSIWEGSVPEGEGCGEEQRQHPLIVAWYTGAKEAL